MDGSSAHRRSLQVETMGLGRVYRARPSRTLSVKCRAWPSGLLELRIRCSARKKARATLELVSIIQLYTYVYSCNNGGYGKFSKSHPRHNKHTSMRPMSWGTPHKHSPGLYMHTCGLVLSDTTLRAPLRHQSSITRVALRRRASRAGAAPGANSRGS